MQNIIDITSKNYKKLIIQVSLDGFVFCVKDSINRNVLIFKEFSFFSFKDTNKLENSLNLLVENFKTNPELIEKYDDVLVIYSNNLSTFVPTALFDEDYLGSYLQYNTKVFETDFFAFDTIENYQMNNVYIPFVNINNFFIDKFGSFEYKHSSTILISKLLELSKNIDTKKMFVHLTKTHFDIAVIQNQKLILYNNFEYKTPEDLIYYILFTAEQLHLNPENFQLELLGNVVENDDFYNICFKYIRNTTLIDVAFLKQFNDFSEAENRTNFILFNS